MSINNARTIEGLREMIVTKGQRNHAGRLAI
ncbi:hypothetical protein SSTU70S_04960 [Stutzerimonas stutzeri]